MSLYYLISSNFTKDEIIALDKQVAENRKGVYLFVRKLPSNSKRKAKKLLVHGMFLCQFSQPLCTLAVVLPVPTPIHRLSYIEQDRILSNKNSYPQIAIIPELKVDKIRLTNAQIQQFNSLAIEINRGSITIEEAVLRLRGGGRD